MEKRLHLERRLDLYLFDCAVLFVNPHFFSNFYNIVKAIGGMFVCSFFAWTIVAMILNLINEYRIGDKRQKRLLLVLTVIALIYLIPKLIKDFR
ncbi:hypothetical protein [Neobacillus niacini]|uniref:hypothetical protein n=1 Tax=Neobacillus niacini TaxID=86668 RepID=UPI002855664C|nr:hypothetical protein [Neobacillus niacini]MDR6999329.1 hypothetical protein [Neobacillus niacini]